tara:strand:- start:9322 stop:9549 length:228 start_codon:yes stop_codon:yes gene_type:complete
MNEIEKLESSLYDFCNYKGIMPTLIVMHPNTFRNLERTNTYIMKSSCNLDTQKLEYRGIKILRSLDVNNEEFFIN